MSLFDPDVWQRVPFHFWSVAFFVFGTIVGSFCNVCIYRMPEGLSVISPPSHCPSCKYSIPWYLNIPLVTWLWLRGRCSNCGAPISFRYFLVELLVGLLFLGAWLTAGHFVLALAYCVLFAGLVIATFIDLAHYIIPDEITYGGMAAGFLLSPFAPAMLGVQTAPQAMIQSAIGLLFGVSVIYAIVRAGKWAFGQEKIELQPGSQVVFTEETVQLPGEEIPYEDLFYRHGDCIEVQADSVNMGERHFENVRIRLYSDRLEIGEETFDPEPISRVEMVAQRVVLPREAMGLGDVKFMGAIGAFLGYKGVVFSLLASSMIGALVGVILIATKKRQWSSRLPYGPYIALAAVIWVFEGPRILKWLLPG